MVSLKLEVNEFLFREHTKSEDGADEGVVGTPANGQRVPIKERLKRLVALRQVDEAENSNSK